MTKNKKKLIRGFLTTETKALVISAGLLIVGAFLGLSGIVDGDVALILAGSVLTVISLYINFSAFLRYQWDELVENVKSYHDMAKTATKDIIDDYERRKNDKS